MRKREQTIAGALRITLVGIVILLQFGLILLLAHTLYTDAILVYLAIEILALVDILLLVSRNKNSSYTIAWILTIVLLPVFGHILYVLWGRNGMGGKRHKKTAVAIEHGLTFLEQDEATRLAFAERQPDLKRMAEYLSRKGFPLCGGTTCDYYSLGESQFEAMLADLERAEKFIFLEFFILSDGVLWDRFHEILERKLAEGVEVRIMYDDFGSVVTAPNRKLKTLRRLGAQILRYNPVHRYISRLYINYRNHQKIAVIDGNIGYTGGTNIADEYVNLYEKHGHWKDTGIRLTGDAVWGLTVTFLSMWDGGTDETADYDRYRPTESASGSGFFQPFADGPANNPDNPAEVMYRQIISTAKDYVYITTPYLVINNSMIDALCTAAESGVDVRIITPKIWDHWYVHAVTRSNYKSLLLAGVRIYEYTPGYIHAKTILSDDTHAVTGSINMDYRSFYLHFENGVFICGDPVLADMKRDIDDTLAASEEISLEDYLKQPWYRKFVGGVLRIFAVLL
ncbi:cardiolipin synthase [Oscillospiraceae bacterium OttesenSCG-928-G22]|nr:cardiolipin synthase [Oscillospiraceae bacterium OttesenSCG-928-G22]